MTVFYLIGIMSILEGTRVVLKIENVKRYPIPYEYHYELRNSLLKKIQESNPHLSIELHDMWNRFFNFSGFLGKQWNTPLGLVFKNVNVVFASPDREAIRALINSIVLNPKLELFDRTMYISSMKKIKLVLPEGISSMKYESLGEIVIKKGNEEGITNHVGVADNLKESLEEIIKEQFYAVSKEEVNPEITILDSRQKKKAIIKNNKVSNSFLALRLRFDLKANEAVHRFVLTQGIGHHRKMGFGLIGVRRDNSV